MSDLCAEDMARIQMDDLITTDSSIVDTAGSSSESHRMTSSGAMELGRRLLASARDGDCATVLQLLAGGAPFTTDWLGTSPLHLAASNNQVAVCEVLLQAGVSRDCRTKVSRTPLHLAAYWGHERVCTLLLDHGADVNCRDMLGMTPLHWAAERGHALACSVLLSRGAERHAVSRFHTTPAGLAEDAGGEVARILAEQGEDEEKQDEEEANMATEFITLDDEREEVDMETIAPEATLQEHKDNAVPASAASEAPGAALLLRHGIALLPADEGGTVLRALQHGRTVLLSDAGKRMLKESSAAPAPAPAPAPGKQPGGGGGGVVLTATPVKAPPPPSAGVKIFTLGNNMLKLGKDKPLTLKRVTEPTTTQYLTLPAGARLVSGSGRGRGQGQGQGHGQGGKRARTEPVKILVNKAGLGRLVGKGDLVRVSREQESGASAAAASAACPENVVRVPEQFLRSKDAEYLRAQLLAATAALHRARMKLKRQ